ncbi:MAG: hypothetical protein OHK0013_49690 [Sandaracinaceae bacterium]
MRDCFCRVLALSTVLALAGCAGEEPRFAARRADPGASTETPAQREEQAVIAAGPAPIRTFEDGSRLFGRELQDGVQSVTLAALSADASSFADRVVRTEGTIERVCQRMGCWMELRAENVAPVRVPLAGHSYFLPRDVAGRPAVIEGRVAVRPLTDDVRRHLESEGAVATTGALSIEATTVLVR